MKTCPMCKEANGDNNTKCFKCGADLPNPIFENVPAQIQRATNEPKKNSEKISMMAGVVCAVGIILGIILGFMFKTQEIVGSYLDYDVEYKFNWTLCIITAVVSICFTLLLMAMSFMTHAIEEK